MCLVYKKLHDITNAYKVNDRKGIQLKMDSDLN